MKQYTNLPETLGRPDVQNHYEKRSLNRNLRLAIDVYKNVDGELNLQRKVFLQEEPGNEARAQKYAERGGICLGQQKARLASPSRDPEPFHAAGF